MYGTVVATSFHVGIKLVHDMMVFIINLSYSLGLQHINMNTPYQKMFNSVMS